MSVAFSPDGRRIASAGGTTIRLWDVASRTPVGEPMEEHTAPINRLVYSRDGTRIASASDDNTIRLWDANTGAPIGDPLVGHENAVFGLAFDADGRRIVSTAEDDTLRVWDVRGGQVLGGHDDKVIFVDFSPDGKRIVSSSFDQTIRQWDVDAGIQTGPLLRTGDVPVGSTEVDRLLKCSAPGTSRMARSSSASALAPSVPGMLPAGCRWATAQAHRQGLSACSITRWATSTPPWQAPIASRGHLPLYKAPISRCETRKCSRSAARYITTSRCRPRLQPRRSTHRDRQRGLQRPYLGRQHRPPDRSAPRSR